MVGGRSAGSERLRGVVDADAIKKCAVQAFGPVHDGDNGCLADEMGKAADAPSRAVVQVLGLRRECSRYVVVEVQDAHRGRRRGSPIPR